MSVLSLRHTFKAKENVIVFLDISVSLGCQEAYLCCHSTLSDLGDKGIKLQTVCEKHPSKLILQYVVSLYFSLSAFCLACGVIGRLNTAKGQCIYFF